MKRIALVFTLALTAVLAVGDELIVGVYSKACDSVWTPAQQVEQGMYFIPHSGMEVNRHSASSINWCYDRFCFLKDATSENYLANGARRNVGFAFASVDDRQVIPDGNALSLSNYEKVFTAQGRFIESPDEVEAQNVEAVTPLYASHLVALSGKAFAEGEHREIPTGSVNGSPCRGDASVSWLGFGGSSGMRLPTLLKDWVEGWGGTWDEKFSGIDFTIEFAKEFRQTKSYVDNRHLVPNANGDVPLYAKPYVDSAKLSAMMNGWAADCGTMDVYEYDTKDEGVDHTYRLISGGDEFHIPPPRTLSVSVTGSTWNVTGTSREIKREAELRREGFESITNIVRNGRVRKVTAYWATNEDDGWTLIQVQDYGDYILKTYVYNGFNVEVSFTDAKFEPYPPIELGHHYKQRLSITGRELDSGVDKKLITAEQAKAHKNGKMTAASKSNYTVIDEEGYVVGSNDIYIVSKATVPSAGRYDVLLPYDQTIIDKFVASTEDREIDNEYNQFSSVATYSGSIEYPSGESALYKTVKIKKSDDSIVSTGYVPHLGDWTGIAAEPCGCGRDGCNCEPYIKELYDVDIEQKYNDFFNEWYKNSSVEWGIAMPNHTNCYFCNPPVSWCHCTDHSTDRYTGEPYDADLAYCWRVKSAERDNVIRKYNLHPPVGWNGTLYLSVRYPAVQEKGEVTYNLNGAPKTLKRTCATPSVLFEGRLNTATGETDIDRTAFPNGIVPQETPDDPLPPVPPLDNAVYVDSRYGNDTSGDGSYDKPFKTIEKAAQHPSVSARRLFGATPEGTRVICLKRGDYSISSSVISEYILGVESGVTVTNEQDFTGSSGCTFRNLTVENIDASHCDFLDCNVRYTKGITLHSFFWDCDFNVCDIRFDIEAPPTPILGEHSTVAPFYDCRILNSALLVRYNGFPEHYERSDGMAAFKPPCSVSNSFVVIRGAVQRVSKTYTNEAGVVSFEDSTLYSDDTMPNLQSTWFSSGGTPIGDYFVDGTMERTLCYCGTVGNVKTNCPAFYTDCVLKNTERMSSEIDYGTLMPMPEQHELIQSGAGVKRVYVWGFDEGLPY